MSERRRKKFVVLCLGKGQKITEISKKLGRDRRTLIKFISGVTKTPRKDKNTQKSISPREMRKIERELVKSPFETSKNIFEKAGVTLKSRASRCRILNKVSKNIKPITKPFLKTIHKEKRVLWAKTYLKQDFSRVHFKIYFIKGYFYR